MKNYLPPEKVQWQARDDGPAARRMHQIVQFIDLREESIPSKAIVIVGFACDEGIRRNQGRVGASEGPYSFRKALAGFPAIDKKICDAGTIFCPNGSMEDVQLELAHVVKRIVEANSIPCLIGGGHEIAWAHFQGLSLTGLAKDIDIINFDAHYDLRPLVEGKGNSGTSFTQIKEYQVKRQYPFKYTCIGNQRYGNTADLHERARELGVQVIPADVFHERQSIDLNNILKASFGVYLTVCMDVFSAAYAPGVSAPQVLGIEPRDAIPLLRTIASSGKVKTFDIAELCPQYDIDQHTARLAAVLFVEIASNLKVM